MCCKKSGIPQELVYALRTTYESGIALGETWRGDLLLRSGGSMIYRFADCALDTQLHILHRVGQSTRLAPKVFEVLCYLIEHRDRVVSKQELCDQVWEGLAISDATLESCLRAVRSTVGDSGQAQRIIQTQRGYGYRFVADLETPSLPDDIPSSPLPLDSALLPTMLLPPGSPACRPCAACRHTNHEDATFCAACGMRLRQPCAHCGQDIRLPATFCTACGQPLVVSVSSGVCSRIGCGYRAASDGSDSAWPERVRCRA